MRRSRAKELRKKAQRGYLTIMDQIKRGMHPGRTLCTFPCYFRRVKELYNSGGIA